MSTMYKPADNKREEFRKYLEKTGVLDALIKSLVTLYEDPVKPQNALDLVKSILEALPPTEELNDTEHLNNAIKILKKENAMLKQRLSKYESNVLNE